MTSPLPILCLEHIFPLDKTIYKLKDLTNKGSRFLHLVDLGNHRATKNPFEGIYSIEPDIYFSKYGKDINLLRADDIRKIFYESDIESTMETYYSFKEFYNENICSYWLDRYDREELFIKTVLFTEKMIPL